MTAGKYGETSPCVLERKELRLSSDYDELKEKITASIRKEQGRQKAILAKRKEKRAIKEAGGGRKIAKQLMSPSEEDFNFGFNSSPEPDRGNSSHASSVHQETPEEMDQRIAEQRASRCMEKITCPACKTFHGYCVEIKEKIMLPTGDGNNSGARSSNRKGGLAYIKIEDLSTSPQEAKILMVRYDEKGTWGPRVTLKLAFKGEMRYLGVKPDKRADPRYKLLLDSFGPDENNWIDERIMLFTEKDDFTESYRMSISVPEKSSAGRRK